MISLILIILIGIVFLFLFKVALWWSGHDRNIPTFEDQQAQMKQNDKRNNLITDHQEDSTFIGVNGKHRIYMKDNAKHIFVCGTTGSGKTVTLSNFMNSIFMKDYPALIVDGKGDINSGSILDVIMTFQKIYKSEKMIYIVDMNHPTTCDKYNPFHGKSPTVIKDMLLAMSDWSEEHYKLNASRFIQRTLYLMRENNIPMTFEKIIQSLEIDEFKKLSLALLKVGKLTKEEHLKNTKLAEISVKTIEGAVARFSSLLESDIGCIFDNRGIDIPTALNQKALILVILNPLIYPELSTLFGRLITIDAKQGVSSLFHKQFKRTFYIFDEVSIYASSELLLLVNLARSANITTILATQSLSDLDNVDIALRKQVIESCNNYLIMRQNEPSNAETWANTIGTKKVMGITYKLDEEMGKPGSARPTREYIYHPDEIKTLQMGEALYISKDENNYYKIKVHKPF